jgi:hypothetical protein
MDYLALSMASLALGHIAGIWLWLRQSERSLDRARVDLQREREEFAKITAQASQANLSLADKIALNDERLNSLDFLVKTGQPRK